MQFRQGWIDNPRAVEEAMADLPFPVVGDCYDAIKDTGKGKTVLLYEYVQQLLGSYNVRRQAIGDCQPKDTLVPGPDNVKNIQDIKVGDRVYASNGEITKVISTLCKSSYSPILTIHTKGGLPLKVTSDHKVLAYQFGEFAATNRRYSPALQQRCINRSGSDSQSKYNVVFSQREAKLVAASELTEADYILCPINIDIDINIPDEMLPYMGSPDLRWMIGLFLGDGHANDRRKILEWGCTTDQPEIESRLCKTLDELNLEWKSYFHCKKISKKARKVYTKKYENLYNLFKKHFYDSNGLKLLPSWAINDDVIKGLLDADGYKTNKKKNQKQRIIFENTSPSLVYGVRFWALNKGYIPSLNKRQRLDKRTNQLNKIAYSVQWSIDKTSRNLWRDDQYLAMPITKIEIEEGPHNEVYDIGVEHNSHTFITESGSAIKNCVSFGAATAVDALKAFEIVRLKQSEEWIAETSTEDIYGGSRVVIGQGRLGNGDGSLGVWAAKWMNQYGTLARQDYGSFDLTTYSGNRAKSWGYRGFPKDDVIKISRDQCVRTVSRVDNVEQARDLLANGYPITIAGNLGFSNQRDKYGFSRRSGSWAHQMCATKGTFIKGLYNKPIEDINVDDLVYDHNGDLQKVSEIYTREYQGNIVKIKISGRGVLELTPNHPVLVFRKVNSQVECFNKVDIDIYANKSYKDSTKSTHFNINKRVCKWVNAEDIRLDDFVFCPKPKLNNKESIQWIDSPKCKNRPNKINLNEKFAWFLGLYAADGNVTKGHKITITCNKKDQALINTCIKFIKEDLGLSCTTKEYKNAIRIICYSSIVANTFYDWFNTGDNKRIPRFVLSSCDLESFVKGFVDGDGSIINDEAYKITNCNQYMIEDLHTILLNLNYSPYINKLSYKDKTYGNENWSDKYELTWAIHPIRERNWWSQDNYICNINDIEVDYINDTVYNLEVENTHTYIANGIVVHNCLIAVDDAGIDAGGRPGFLCQNSWGKWNSGPKRLNQPEGSFWMTYDDARYYFRQGDCWALSDFDGFEKKIIEWDIL